MPPNNRFRHQDYLSPRRTSDIHLLRPDPPTAVPIEQRRRQLSAAGQAYRQANVRAIYLTHGTFVGADALGIIREVSRVWRAPAEHLRRLAKQLADTIQNDAGNYTNEYAATFEQGIQAAGEFKIPVRLFNWSSENHHLGRADGAIRLLGELASHPELAGGRVLLWGHSHGGNVLALISNLLAADDSSRRKFFRAARSYYRRPGTNVADLPEWTNMDRLLSTTDCPPRGMKLDFVTFGTPVRYGWDSGGYEKLLHFVNHRPMPGLSPELALFPPELDDVMAAAHGDYIQQTGIAGTNLPPTLWAWRSWLAEVRLSRLLQPKLRRRDLWTRLKQGVRAHDEGVTLLVDYGPAEGHLGQHLAGHAVYTKREWLPFHAEQVARRLYNLSK